jgi:hypothetical protein
VVILPRLKIKEGQQMVIRKSLVSLAAAGLVLGSSASAATPTAAREGSPVAKSDKLAGIGTFGLLIGLVVIAGVVAIVLSDNHHKPKSP